MELQFRFNGTVPRNVVVRFSDIKQARPDDHPAPWDIHVTILWGDEIAFDRPLSGADPLHAVELAARFTSSYLSGRAKDEGGVLVPPIHEP